MPANNILYFPYNLNQTSAFFYFFPDKSRFHERNLISCRSKIPPLRKIFIMISFRKKAIWQSWDDLSCSKGSSGAKGEAAANVMLC